MALAIPGGAPGYDYDKELCNNIAHATVQLLEDCAEHSDQTLKVKGSRWLNAILINLAGLRALGERFSLPRDA